MGQRWQSSSKSGTKGKVQKLQKASIFSGMENEKIKLLFDEIKQAEKNKELDKKSDDEMVEGSSDGEGDEDDLSPKQNDYLLQMIKGGKYKSISRSKLRNKSRPIRKTSEDLTAPEVRKERLE